MENAQDCTDELLQDRIFTKACVAPRYVLSERCERRKENVWARWATIGIMYRPMAVMNARSFLVRVPSTVMLIPWAWQNGIILNTGISCRRDDVHSTTIWHTQSFGAYQVRTLSMSVWLAGVAINSSSPPSRNTGPRQQKDPLHSLRYYCSCIQERQNLKYINDFPYPADPPAS